ncbi:hypothetical protein H0X06_06485 [Candidatus Dependentiae bacterium]|nr:hypothetical protein [Candidatus Dependentiae bacterium]
MILFFFWPLPLWLFIPLMGLVGIGGFIAIFSFPKRSLTMVKSLVAFYSMVTLLYVAYSFRSGLGLKRSFDPTNSRLIIVECIVLVLVFGSIYGAMQNRLKKG